MIYTFTKDHCSWRFTTPLFMLGKNWNDLSVGGFYFITLFPYVSTMGMASVGLFLFPGCEHLTWSIRMPNQYYMSYYPTSRTTTRIRATLTLLISFAVGLAIATH